MSKLTVIAVLGTMLLAIMLTGCSSDPEPTEKPTPEPTATPTPEPTTTSTPSPTATPDLTKPIHPPEHIAYIWWSWEDAEPMEAVEIAFTVHTDLEEWTTSHGIYLMLCSGWISDTQFYFGLQHDDRGERAIFSRWDERDLAFARAHAQDGWTQSSGHEGDFIGVRRHFDWRPGDYIARLAPTDEDTEGEWYEFWITEIDTGTETWVGALWFPDDEDGQAGIYPSVYSTVEIFGITEIRPADIPLVHVAMARPVGDGRHATHGDAGYEHFDKPVPNSEIRYDAGVELVDIKVGGETVRMTDPWYRPFAE